MKQQKVTKLLSNREIDAALTPQNYIGVAPIIVDRIIEKLMR
jgi:adenylosuccinate lyase